MNKTLEIFSVYDEKSMAYLTPFFLPNSQLAIRAFSDCVADPNHNFGAHPSDYTLFFLGYFDSETGEFNDPHLSPVITGVAAYAQNQSEKVKLEQNQMKLSLGEEKEGEN